MLKLQISFDCFWSHFGRIAFMKVKLLKVNTSVTKGPWQRWTQSSPSVLFSVFSGVWVWLCCMSAHKPPRSSCSFMWRRPLSRADLALQRAFSVPKPPSFICRSDSARPSLCTRSPFIWKRSRFGRCRSTPPPPVSLCLHLSVTLLRVLVSQTRLSLPPFSFRFLSIVLLSPVLSVPHLASVTSPTNKHTHLTHLLS